MARSWSETLWPRLNVLSQAHPVRPLAAVPGQAIPRILHQTYHSRSLPPPLQTAVAHTRAAATGWTCRLYDDEDIVDYIHDAYGTDMLGEYRRINPAYGAARADLFRYLLMYQAGGVYLDIKSVATRALDQVLQPDDRYLLSQWHGARFAGMGMGVHAALKNIPGTEYQQWHVVAAPGHPFLLQVIESVLRNLRVYNPGIHGVGRQGVLSVTGPIAYTRAIHPLRPAHPHRLVDSAQDLGFDYNIFMTGRNSSAHTFLFRTHYAQLRQPLVSVGPMRRIYGFPCRAARKLLRVAHLAH